MAGAYTLGFESAIATTLNMFPKLGLEILESVQNSKLKEAKAKQEKLNSLIDIVVKNGKNFALVCNKLQQNNTLFEMFQVLGCQQ